MRPMTSLPRDLADRQHADDARDAEDDARAPRANERVLCSKRFTHGLAHVGGPCPLPEELTPPPPRRLQACRLALRTLGEVALVGHQDDRPAPRRSGPRGARRSGRRSPRPGCRSARRRGGSRGSRSASARAIATRCISPPESCRGPGADSRCPEARLVRRALARSSAEVDAVLLRCRRSVRPEQDVLHARTAAGARKKDWKTNPISRPRRSESSRSESPLTSLPSNRYRPELVSVRRPSRYRSVVFPEPEAPTIDTNSPESTSSETPLSACTSSPGMG